MSRTVRRLRGVMVTRLQALDRWWLRHRLTKTDLVAWTILGLVVMGLTLAVADALHHGESWWEGRKAARATQRREESQ